jgi:hypothetical protein
MPLKLKFLSNSKGRPPLAMEIWQIPEKIK